jgi:hypothetical protein
MIDDNYVINDRNRERLIWINVAFCTSAGGATCPGNGGWVAPSFMSASASYVFGIINLHFEKNAITRFEIDDSNINSLTTGYQHTAAVIWANVTIFMLTKRNCNPNGLYWDEDISDCTNNCGATSLYFIA